MNGPVVDKVCLADIWPRMGFSQIRFSWVSEPLRVIIRRRKPSSEGLGDAPNIITLYSEQIARWGMAIDKLPASEQSFVNGALTSMPVVLAYRQLSLQDIETRLRTRHETDLISDKQSIWRWKYYQFAYTVVWALIFHEPNALLAHPWFLFKKVLDVWRDIHSETEELDSEEEQKQHLCWLMLALLERIYGMRYDIANDLPHYRANITERIELSPEDRKKRAVLFAGAVDYFEEACFRVLKENLQQ